MVQGSFSSVDNCNVHEKGGSGQVNITNEISTSGCCINSACGDLQTYVC